jgi:hypothetical protein
MTMLFNYAFEYAIMKVQEKQVGPKWNGTNQMLVQADVANLLGNKINALRKT